MPIQAQAYLSHDEKAKLGTRVTQFVHLYWKVKYGNAVANVPLDHNQREYIAECAVIAVFNVDIAGGLTAKLAAAVDYGKQVIVDHGWSE